MGKEATPCTLDKDVVVRDERTEGDFVLYKGIEAFEAEGESEDEDEDEEGAERGDEPVTLIVLEQGELMPRSAAVTSAVAESGDEMMLLGDGDFCDRGLERGLFVREPLGEGDEAVIKVDCWAAGVLT